MTPAVEAQALLCMGTLESDLVWNKVDYVQNIKVGVCQWTGGDAVGLLNTLLPTDKELLAQTLLDDMTTYGQDDPFWRSRFLSKDEGNSVIEALGSIDAQNTQRAYFSSMLSGYESRLGSWGFVAGGTALQQKAFIFVACVYHVDIVAANRLVAALGSDRLPDEYYRGVQNMPIASRNWGVLRSLLNAWDGEEPTITGEETQPDDGPGGAGQESTPIIQVESQIQKIGATGQTLIVYGEDNPDGVVCYRITDTLWVPYINTAAPPTPTPTEPEPTPPDPVSPPEWEQMRQLWLDNKRAWYYSNNAGRLDPPASGYSDCSACIIWAITQIRPDLRDSLGEWTGTMRYAGELVQSGYMGEGAYVDPAILKPGDFLLVGTNDEYDNGAAHVEWYFGEEFSDGEGSGNLWGAGYGPLPHASGDINYYIQHPYRGRTHYMIRRVL